mmetsp:Transcript_30305/g.87927  ORF Transcript_30305/g.87927 Transcript_30305/m.87927 type:complete len:227 (+) Transcript_30305:862-1542(+)
MVDIRVFLPTEFRLGHVHDGLGDCYRQHPLALSLELIRREHLALDEARHVHDIGIQRNSGTDIVAQLPHCPELGESYLHQQIRDHGKQDPIVDARHPNEDPHVHRVVRVPHTRGLAANLHRSPGAHDTAQPLDLRRVRLYGQVAGDRAKHALTETPRRVLFQCPHDEAECGKRPAQGSLEGACCCRRCRHISKHEILGRRQQLRSCVRIGGCQDVDVLLGQIHRLL